jgi:L-asparaginase
LPLHCCSYKRPRADKPRIVVLATGGTIAGAAQSDVQAKYTSGQVGVEQLLPPPSRKARATVATLRGEQISNIGSQDMNDEVWLKLAQRVNELVAMPTSTASSSRTAPTRSRRRLLPEPRREVDEAGRADRVDAPSTALSADGPLNFFNAVAVAANKDAVGRGVLVVVNDWIHGASSLTKTSTTAVQTFLSPLRASSDGRVRRVRVLSRPVAGTRRIASSRSTASRRCRASTSSWPTRTWTARSSTPPSPPGARAS